MPEMTFQIVDGFLSKPLGKSKVLSFFFLLDGTFLMAEPEFIHSIINPDKGITIPSGVDHFFLNADQGAFLLKLAEEHTGCDITLQVSDQPGVVWVLEGRMVKDFMDAFHSMMDEDVRERLVR